MTSWDTFCLPDEETTHLKRQSFPVRPLKFVDNVLQGTLREVGGALGNIRCNLSRKRKSVCPCGPASYREVDCSVPTYCACVLKLLPFPLPTLSEVWRLNFSWPPVTLSSHEISSEPIQGWGRWTLRSSEQLSPLIVRWSLVKTWARWPVIVVENLHGVFQSFKTHNGIEA
jgi:hypothetical protein